MEEKHKSRRKIIIVKKALQYKFASVVMVSMLLVACSIGWDIYHSSFRAIKALNPPDSYSMMLKINNLMIGKLAVLFIIVFIIVIFISHRVAGPIFIFERSCDNIANGDLTYRVHLRNGDQFEELKDKFNRMIFEIHKRITKDKLTADTAIQKLSDVSLRLSSKDVTMQELSEISAELEAIKTDLNRMTSGFKI